MIERDFNGLISESSGRCHVYYYGHLYLKANTTLVEMLLAASTFAYGTTAESRKAKRFSAVFPKIRSYVYLTDHRKSVFKDFGTIAPPILNTHVLIFRSRRLLRRELFENVLYLD